MKTRMADDAIRDTAFENLAAETQKRVSLPLQTSLYDALAAAERVGQRFVSQHSRKGGRARKTDTLQELIEQLVRRNPTITEPELLKALRRHQPIEPIQDIEGKVVFFTTHDGRTKQAKLSGLKDRLRRAKQRLGSR